MAKEKNQRTSSLVRTIRRHYQMQRLRRIFFVTILFFLIASGAFFLGASAAAGADGLPLKWTFELNNNSSSSSSGRSRGQSLIPTESSASDSLGSASDGSGFSVFPWNSLTLVMTGQDGTVSRVPAGTFATILLFGTAAVFFVQFFFWLLAWIWENGRLRLYLKPIDDMALAAEHLSEKEFDLHKLDQLADSLNEIKGSDAQVSIGDRDLAGLENAINNLLKRLQKSYREQTRFVDDASHELRTPVAVIQGYASMLERWGMNDRATLEESVHAIREESDHMKTLIDQLLFLARGDMGRQKMKWEAVDLKELLTEVRDESELIDAGHIYILKQAPALKTAADPAMLKQAVRILVDNAAKYTPEGKEIRLSLKQTEPKAINASSFARRDNEEKSAARMAAFPCAVLSVEDEGQGIPPEEIGHIFERFYRGENVRGSTPGSGLGLSIAAWIADNHSGELSAVSVPGIGSRFSLSIPLTEFHET